MPPKSFAPDDTKDKVLAATDIVQLIGQSVKLTKRGKNYVGLCPFHNERGPSFNVNPEKQFFHCFGCSASGDALTFVMKRDRLTFPDALRLLAKAANIEMPERGGFSKERQSERQAMLDAHVAAVSHFQAKLQDAQVGAAAREYLEKRGFNAEIIEKFRVGVAPEGWDHLLRSPLMKKYPPPILATAGLVKPRDNGNGFYDTFRNRLMFPIRNETGQTVAFGGRVMPGSDDKAKYLNSPESPLFSKGKNLYGLDFAKARILETETVAIVEGYTDVMMAHQYGVSNVVAVLGTALVDAHVTLLRRFAKRIVLLFDADAAGDKAADRVVQMFLTQPIEIAVASIPEGLDPDEFLIAHGAEAFEKVLGGAIDVLSFKWKLLARKFMEHKNDLTGQSKAVEEYLDLLAKARGSGPVDSIRWGSALARVSRLTEIPIDELNRRFKTPRGNPQTAKPQAAVQVNQVTEPKKEDAPRQPNAPRTPLSNARRLAERRILGILLSEPDRWADVQVSVGTDDFLDEQHREIAEVYWSYQRDEGELVFSTFLSLTEDESIRELAIGLVEEVDALKETSLKGPASAGTDAKTFIGETLAGDVQYITATKDLGAHKKRLAAIGRNDEESLAEQLDQFEALVKNKPSTNVNWVGPVKRSR